MNYTLHQLRVFLKVSETQSITRAAEQLSLTQPAVSIQLKKFQEEFNRPLTEVVGRKLYITDFGKEIAGSCREILELASELKNKGSSMDGLLTGTLKVAVSSTGMYVAPYLISRFIRLNPGVELSLNVTNKSGVLEQMENNEADFALISGYEKEQKWTSIEIMDNPVYCVSNEKLAKKPITPSSNFILREEGSATRKRMKKYLKDRGWDNVKYLEMSSNEAVKHAVKAGMGYSCLPIVTLKNEIDNGDLVVIPMEETPLPSKWHIVYREDKKFSLTAKAYLKFIQEERVSLVGEHFSWMDNYLNLMP